MFELPLNEYAYSGPGTAQGISSLSKLSPDEIIDLRCRRAISFNATKYSMIRNICIPGTYNLPLDYERGHHESA